MVRLSVLIFALLLACDALALPIELAIAQGSLWAVDGDWVQTGVTGSLRGELQDDGRLTDIYGEIVFDASGVPADLLAAGFDGSLRVVAGTLDLHGDGDASSTASFLAFENGLHVYFADEANAFDGSDFRLSGTSWDALAGQTREDVNLPLGMELGTEGTPERSARPIPEPASLGLLAAGGLIIGAALRRPLRS